jgi:hypothetical protein
MLTFLSQYFAAKKRVLLAKDVLSLLQEGKIIAQQDKYFESKHIDLSTVSSEESFQKLLQEDKEPCEVCAVGSLLVCAVKRYNKAKIKDIRFTSHRDDDDNSLGSNDALCFMKILERYFSREQIVLIKSAFEKTSRGIDSCFHGNLQPDDLLIAQEKYKDMDSEQTMIAIMQNIIDNNGTFVV